MSEMHRANVAPKVSLFCGLATADRAQFEENIAKVSSQLSHRI